MDPVFFKNPAEFRRWLDKHHETETEVLVGYRKTATGLPSMTWPESVDEALCYGWIDGIRRSIDEKSYTIRFTPRKPESAWSAVNIRKIETLTKLGRMKPAGMRAWENRHRSRGYGYGYSSPNAEFGEAHVAEFKKHQTAWEFFDSQPPSYKRTVSHWVLSAKREETREKRFKELIADSANQQRLGRLTKYASKPKGKKSG